MAILMGLLRHPVATIAAVLSTVAVGWWAWTEPPSVLQPASPTTTAVVPKKQAQPLTAISPPAQVVRPAQSLLPATTEKMTADQRLADIARRSDYYQDYADRLRQESVNELALQWPDVAQRADLDELPAFIAAFAQVLRESKDESVYSSMGNTLAEPSTTSTERSALLTLMGRTATPQAMKILTDYLASDAPKEEIAELLRDNIREATATFIDKQWNFAVSPILETAWHNRNPTLTEADRATLAQGIAYLGTTDGTRALLDTVRSIKPDDPDRNIAMAAISSLERNEPVPVLEEALTDEQQNIDVSTLAMTTLVNIGTRESHSVLLKYLTNVKDMGTEQQQMLSTALSQHDLSDESAKLIRNAVEHQSFANDTIKSILMDALVSRSN